MKNNISALMDGELFEDEAEALFDGLKRDSEAHRDWAAYHLIGDVLRQPEYIHRDISGRVRELMRNEPTVLAPRTRGISQKVRNIGLSAAASLMALGVVMWMSVQITPETTPQLAMQQTTPPNPPSHCVFSSGLYDTVRIYDASPFISLLGENS